MGYASKTLLEEVLEERPDYPKPGVFVETGTYKAQSILAMTKFFEEAHTIEIEKGLFDKAVKKCAGTGIHLHHGDSAEIVPRLAKQLGRPAIWYLDAHWFPDSQVHGEKPFPLWDELKAIVDREQQDIIIVDDLHAFGRRCLHNGKEDLGSWWEVSVKSLEEFVGPDRLEHCFKHVAGDCVILYLKGA